jgi:putative ABC transport system ATP-binding protein
MNQTNSASVRLVNVSMSYTEATQKKQILDRVNCEFPAAELTVLLGPSGSGKSSLLHLISGLDTPESGEIWCGDICLSHMNERQRTLFRREQMGIVFQFFNLIPTLTVLENVLLPAQLLGKKNTDRAFYLLEQVGLADRFKTYPDRLSGGEQQRVALARALVHEPRLILADEPTGNLDQENGEAMMALLLKLTRQIQKTLILVTHNPEFSRLTDSVFKLESGQLNLQQLIA